MIKSCIERGHPTFTRDLRLRSEEIRAVLDFSGPADPLEGDAPYRRVREEADKVINIMFDDNARKEDPTKKRGSRGQRSIEGGASIPSGAGVGGTQYSSFGGAGAVTELCCASRIY